MRKMLSAVAVLSALIATDASAQVNGVSLSGPWQCVASCFGPPGSLAYITQNGWELNVVNDAGQASRAWVDYPGRIWVRLANQGAIYTPDGLTLQFDGGAIWQRPQVLPPRARRRR